MGLGTQDSLADGKKFADRYNVTFPLLWEEAYESWSAFGITRQPASVLVSKDGVELKRFQGPLDQGEYDEVVQAIAPA